MKNKITLLLILLPVLLNAQQRQQEIKLLQKALTTLHPGIYRYETPAQVDSDFALALRKVQEPMPENRYMILVAQLLTHVHCGHTYTNYWNQPKAIKTSLYSKTCLPFLFRMIGREMIVTHNLSGAKTIKPGDRVMSINGLSVSRIVDSLLTVSPSDGLHGLVRKLDNISIEPLDADTDNYNLLDIYFPLFFPANLNTVSYKLTLQHNDIYKTITVPALNKKTRLAIYEQRFGKLPVHEQDWSLKMLTPQTACFTIGDFETWTWKADYKKYLDSIFILLRQKQVKNLVIDIRGNGGGADDARDEVFSYLTNRPFGCEDPMLNRVRFLAIPDTLLPFLKTWDSSFKQPKNPADYQKLPDGLYENSKETTAPCEPVQPKFNHFTGRVFLLTDNRNSSTTFTMAKLFRTMNIGRIIGEETGGNQQGINGGQFFFLYLPYSGIEVDIPLTWGAYAGNHPDTGIEPDDTVATTRRTIAERKDPQLDFVLNQASF